MVPESALARVGTTAAIRAGRAPTRLRRGVALALTAFAVLSTASCGAWPGAEQSTTTASSDPTEETPVTIRYEVEGIKKAKVFYFDVHGDYVGDVVTLPWHIELRFDDISEAELVSVVADQPTIVEPHMGTLACTITIDGEVVANDEDVPSSASDTRHVDCGFTRGDEEL